MNQMNALNPLRITTIGGRPNYFLGNGQDSGNSSVPLGVDEVVIDSCKGTLAMIQDPPNLMNFINNRDGGCLIM